MKFYDKDNDAAGGVPDFGAIFMSSSATKRECLQRRLFGLPSSLSQFVEQVKAGMILFLFEYEKRELHGVFKSCCDGGMNIVPDAFSSSGKQFPAQVKFIPIWDCRPLPESKFRNAIRENYFSAKKFNFGLSENQVYRLLYLFNMRKLELELPGGQLTRMKDVKPEWYPVGKVGGSIDGDMNVEIVKNEQDAVANTLPFKTHKYQRDSLQYNGEVDDCLAFLQDDSRFNRHGDMLVDSASGYDSDYLAFLQDDSRFNGHDKEHCIGIQPRPTISVGLSGNLSGEVRVHEDDKLQMSDRPMSEHTAKTGQRVVFTDDSSGLHNSNVNLSFFSSKPMLNSDSLVQNQLRPTSAVLCPIQAQISDNSCEAQGDASSKSIFLHDPNGLGSSSVRNRINDNSNSLQESSPSNNYRRNSIYSLNDQPSHTHKELKDMKRFQDDSYGLVNHVPDGSNRTCMPFYAVQISEQLDAKTIVYEGRDNCPLKSSSVPLPPSDIGKGGWGSEPLSSLYYKYHSGLSNDVHPIALQESLGHEVILRKNNKTCTPVGSWENEGHSQVQYGEPFIHVHDLDHEFYRNSGSSKSGYSKKNSSVFSRLSFAQDFNNRENGSNNWRGEYDVCTTSVDEVMDMVRHSHNLWMIKRKLKPLVKHNNAESSMYKKQIISSRLKRASYEKSSDDISIDITTASEGQSNQVNEEIHFLDFKRRSRVRKINEDADIRGFNESERNEDLGIVQRKKRKLIRPNFSKSTTSDKKGINLGASQNLQVSLQESSDSKDDIKSYIASVQTEENIKIDVEEPHLVCQTHFEDKSNHARGCLNCKEGKARDRWLVSKMEFNDGSECPENLNNQNVSSSASCEAKRFHNKEGLYMKDNIKPISPNRELLHSVCQAHQEEKVIGASRGDDTGEGISKDARPPLTIEVKDGSECSQNFVNENAAIETYFEKRNCNIDKGSNVHHESKCASVLVESSETCEESSEKENAFLSITENVDRSSCYFGEAASDSRMPDSSIQGLK